MFGRERKVDSLRVIDEEGFQFHLKTKIKQERLEFGESVKALRDLKIKKDEKRKEKALKMLAERIENEPQRKSKKAKTDVNTPRTPRMRDTKSEEEKIDSGQQ